MSINPHNDQDIQQNHKDILVRDTQAWMFSKEGLPHYVGMERIKKENQPVSFEMKDTVMPSK